MTIGEILCLILVGGLVIIAMILTIIRIFEPDKKCRTCSWHLNPGGEIYCGKISDSPNSIEIIFCRDKI